MKTRDVVLVLLVLYLATRRAKGSSTMQPQAFATSVKRWETPLLLGGSEVVAPITFMLSWLRVESGGNPCAVGTPTAEGGPLSPEGEPWEVSIWQLDPGNLAKAGFTAKQLRPCCPNPTGTRAQVESCTRELTSDEISAQVQAGLNYIRFCRGVVDAALNGVKAFEVAGTTWTHEGPSIDYLRAVKSVHGSPDVMAVGVAAVARKLGRAPSSWSELAGTLRADPSLTPRLNVRRKSGELLLEAVLRNAEETVPA